MIERVRSTLMQCSKWLENRRLAGASVHYQMPVAVIEAGNVGWQPELAG
jgi:hypothetical protein